VHPEDEHIPKTTTTEGENIASIVSIPVLIWVFIDAGIDKGKGIVHGLEEKREKATSIKGPE